MNHQNPSRLYLLRHAKSAWASPGERDFTRTLDDEGFAQAEIIADKAADRNYRPDRVVSSTAARCRQTAEAIRRAMDHDVEILFTDTLYNAPCDTYLEIVSANRDSSALMLIGHNPTMEEVLDMLVGSSQAAAAIPAGYPTAGLAVLERAAESPLDGRWRLVDFLIA